jgi:tRNA threonylcarbamoyladenosine biosynthesis protein TsaB
MRVIALDTTTRSGSIALVEDDRVVDERGGDATRTHAQRLPADIVALLDAHGTSLAGVDLYAVASGPGSFTGLRIGIATVQGLAMVQGRPAAGISALEALAQVASVDSRPGALIAALIDGHRREVFAAVYRVTSGRPFTRARLVEMESPAAGDPVAMFARWRERFDARIELCVGDGAVLYADAIAQAMPSAAVVAPPLLAGAIGRMAIERHAESVPPGGLRALYVRRPDVELERERTAARPQ